MRSMRPCTEILTLTAVVSRYIWYKIRYVAFLNVVLVGCGSDVTGVQNPHQTLLRVQMNIPAALMSIHAPYNTLQLQTTAYRGTGEPIVDAVPTFAASDKSLSVTDEGLVTALLATSGSFVVASVTYEGVTQRDTTWINVTAQD